MSNVGPQVRRHLTNFFAETATQAGGHPWLGVPTPDFLASLGMNEMELEISPSAHALGYSSVVAPRLANAVRVGKKIFGSLVAGLKACSTQLRWAASQPLGRRGARPHQTNDCQGPRWTAEAAVPTETTLGCGARCPWVVRFEDRASLPARRRRSCIRLALLCETVLYNST